MASLFSILSIARDGIVAQTGALNVTSQNVAGASTPGYVRRVPVLSSNAGGGVEMTGTKRTFDAFTYAQLLEQQAHLSAATARSNAVADVEALVAPASDTISDRIDALTDAFAELSTNPNDSGVRSAVLAAAESLAQRFSETADGLQSFRGELYSQARDVATEVNDRIAQIAKLDQNIAEATGRGQDSAGLRDQRDQLISEVGDRVGARVVENNNGSITLFAAGTVLYEGGIPAKLDVSVGTDGALKIQSTRGGNVVDVTNSLSTGKLAGIQEARDSDIPEMLNSLDALAHDVATTFNGIHSSGFGLDGGTGRALFSTPATASGAAHAIALDPGMVGHPEYIAASGTASDIPGGNDIASKLANAGTTTLPGGGTMSERYAGITSKIGVIRSVAEGEVKMREDTVATASALRESASGVSTDEEMVNLTQYQRAFQASTRVLQMVDELFDTLMKSI